ncbi:MAG TPA: Fe(2+)-trafficking protein [Planctomycetota bacterium]|nr:Fe(2+)-trafficking protein [Planctomycetota bacterium]
MQGPEERLLVFERMARADPTNELAHFSLGKLHFEAGRLAEAEASLRRTLELNPAHAQAHRYLGEALLRTGARDEAVRILLRGVEIAHAKGELQPRNQMQEALRRAGIDSPAPEGPHRIVKGPLPPGAPTTGFLCARCGSQGPPLREPPLPGSLGQRIHERICETCWREWISLSVKVINEYRLNLATPEGGKIYDEHLREFLRLED